MPLTQKRLKELLHYDPDTGVWTRIKSRGRTDLVGAVCDCVDGGGYICIRIDSGRYKAHRLAFLYMLSRWPKDEVDHIDLNLTNNKWANLREATHIQNMRNIKVRADNVSKMKGVTYFAGGYQARITVNRKRVFLGFFKTPQEAYSAYLGAAAKHFGAFMRE